MKKVAVILAAVCLSLTACHYGKDEAAETLERNKAYKEAAAGTPAADINPDYVQGGGKATDTTKKAADTATAATPAAQPAH
jgi:hypothetical protein